MSECECEKRVDGRREYTAAIKICDCDCDCDCRCCIDLFYSTIEDDPNRLKKMDKIQFVHTPLHDAAAAGNTTLAVEIMNLRPSLAKKLNPQGLSPLHLAVESRNATTALALVKLDKQLVRIKGKGGLTPLHCAAARKPDDVCQMELLAGLLAECPDAMGVLNNRLQSAVHVALENENVEAARLLMNWVVIVAKESDLSIKDAHGNTTLHVAARYCRCRELLQLLTKLVKVNKANKYGETALDIAIHHNNGDAVEMLKNAGAVTRTTRGQQQNLPRKPSTTVRYLRGNHADKCAEMLTRAYYFITKELTMDMRNTILVVAVLIATTTYQGVLQPPGGVYAAEGNSSAADRVGWGRRLGDINQTHPPGRADGDGDHEIQLLHADEHAGLHLGDADHHLRAPRPGFRRDPAGLLDFHVHCISPGPQFHLLLQQLFEDSGHRVLLHPRHRLLVEDRVLFREGVLQRRRVAAAAAGRHAQQP